MGDLRYDRIEIGQPLFYNTGIDYFGPILTKQSRRTRSATGKIKRWGALFTCLNTRAVHLKVVWDLTTDFLYKDSEDFVQEEGIHTAYGVIMVKISLEQRANSKQL